MIDECNCCEKLTKPRTYLGASRLGVSCSRALQFEYTGRQGYFVMGHKTAKANIARQLKATKEWLKDIRCTIPLKEWWSILKAKLIGHYNYFGVSGNYRKLYQFYQSMYWMTLKWINRRSQKKV